MNYVLGRFDHSRTTFSSSSPVPQQSTVGALDLGGASAQITFEVDDKVTIEHLSIISVCLHTSLFIFCFYLIN